MLIEELIFERSRASLYHFTTVQNAYLILKSNKIGSSLISSRVSFTRNSGFNILKDEPAIRLEFDQDKLKTKYKIRPHKYQWPLYIKHKPDEFEEVIIGTINDVNKYLIEISIFDIKAYDKYLDFLYKDTENEYYNKPEIINILKYFEYLVHHPNMRKNDIKPLKNLMNKYRFLMIGENNAD